MILQFRNDSRVQYHPSYREAMQNSLHTSERMLTGYIESAKTPEDKRFFERRLEEVKSRSFADFNSAA